MEATPVPVFMRIGEDGAEHEIGSFTPDMHLDRSSTWATLSAQLPLAEFLRSLADAIERPETEA